MKILNFSSGLLLLYLGLFSTASVAVEAAGEITRVSGDKIAHARGVDGKLRNLSTGDAIYSGEAVSTGKDTSLLINFADNSRFAIGSKSEMMVDKFSYKQGAKDNAFHSSFIRGAFRFISGLVAQSSSRDMKVNVIVATIGVRGTRVEGEVAERQEKDGAMVDASAKVVLLEPEEESKKTSIIVSNDYGSVIIDEPGYGTEIPDEKSPPSAVRKMQIHTIENILRSQRNSVRQGGTPRPRM